jgi:conjugal transfer mating pair stabilization protein TraG
MKIVIEILFYAIFPFVAIMVCLPGASSILKTYFYGLVWLQTWAPLYSILNMIIAVYCTDHTFSAATTFHALALTYDTIPALGEAAQAVSSYASYAMMSVPFLSWGLLKYGGGAMAQLSTTLSQPTQSAAGMAAQEATSGNFSMGVRNFDSTSRHNINSFKQDENSSVATGSSSFQTGDGSILKITSGGEGVIDKNASMSKLGVNLNDKHELSSSMNQMSSKSLAKAQNSLNAYGTSMNAAFDMAQNFTKSRGENSSNDHSIGADQSSSMSEAIQRANNIAKSFSKATGVDERESREKLHSLSAGFGGSIGVGVQKGIPFFGLNANANADARVSGHAGYDYKKQWSNTDSSSVNATSQEQLQMARDYKESMDEVARISKSENFRDSSVEAANFSDGISSKLSEAKNYRRDMQSSLNESESWQKSANIVNSSSTGVVDDLSQDFVNYGVEQRNADGYKYQLDGLSRAMNDPSQRSKLIEGFMQSRKDEIFKLYSDNKTGDQASISSSYKNEQNEQMINDLKDRYHKMLNMVSDESANHGLDKPIDRQAMEAMGEQWNSNSESFNKQKQEIVDESKKIEQERNDFNENHPLDKK